MSSGLWTLFAMAAFVGITIWVFWIKDRKDFDQQAHMPLEEDDERPGDSNEEESQ